MFSVCNSLFIKKIGAVSTTCTCFFFFVLIVLFLRGMKCLFLLWRPKFMKKTSRKMLRCEFGLHVWHNHPLHLSLSLSLCVCPLSLFLSPFFLSFFLSPTQYIKFVGRFGHLRSDYKFVQWLAADSLHHSDVSKKIEFFRGKIKKKLCNF